jgi:hypothetical protein
MRSSLLAAALLSSATSLAAQKPKADTTAPTVVRENLFKPLSLYYKPDTAAILRAAADSTWRFAGGNSLEILADTAWVMVVKTTGTYCMSPDISSDETTVAFENQVSRVERRNGKWVLVRRQP